MAKIIPSLGEIVGSIGGNTFQRNRSGQIVRQRPRVTKHSTSRQQIAHQNQQRWLSAWQYLTQSQRDEWNVYAGLWTKENKFGQTKALTGANWFESLASISFVCDALFNTSPPTHILPDAVPNFRVNISDTAIKIRLLDSYDNDLNYLFVWVTMPTGKSTNSLKQIMRVVGKKTGAGLALIDITAGWEAATGLVYNPTVNFPALNLYVGIQTVQRTSYITSPILWKSVSASAISGGIGTMIIESTFVVS